MLRFELENELINGKVQVGDLPREWNDRMEAYLGVRPPNDALGVMQDIHWSAGLFGYFPDYLLGSIFSVQLWNQMQQDIPEVEAHIVHGDFAPILAWQRTHIHQYGSKLTFPELAERITGGPLQWEPYMDYLETKYAEIYGL
jgi:carboxypeptidase Taq